jgi:hypothetical protein
MSVTETVIEGTLNADGTLVLHEKPNLPPGRVQVVLRQETAPVLPGDDPFWQRMRAIWAIPRSAGHTDDGGERTLEEVRQMRQEWDEHQGALERLQREGRTGKPPSEGPRP